MMPRAVFASALLALSACASAPTQLIVAIDTNMPVPDQVDEIKIEITGPLGGRLDPIYAQLSPPDAVTLPVTIGIEPNPVHDGLVTVLAHGLPPNVVRQARTGFIEGETRILFLTIEGACLGVPCPSDQTCIAGVCSGIDVPTESLYHCVDGDYDACLAEGP